MIQWTKPVFEEFDVSGECTAYAGALRAETLASDLRAGRPGVSHRDRSVSDLPVETGSAQATQRDAT